MALIDVSGLLLDPDFTDTVQLITRARAVDGFGENVLTPTNQGDKIMVVQPAKPSMLERLPEGAKLKDAISVWYRGLLNVEAVNGYSDVIIWKGDRYAVVDVDDFKHYGPGYTKALCIREQPNA